MLKSRGVEAPFVLTVTQVHSSGIRKKIGWPTMLCGGSAQSNHQRRFLSCIGQQAIQMFAQRRIVPARSLAFIDAGKGGTTLLGELRQVEEARVGAFDHLSKCAKGQRYSRHTRAVTHCSCCFSTDTATS